MTVCEMEGFLRGKCLPGDMKVNETHAQYLVRKFSELQSQSADLALQLANAESKCRELAAENGRCKFEISRCHQTVDEMFKNRDKWVDKEWLSAIWSTSKRLMNETPATDAFLAEVRAQGVEMFAKNAEGAEQGNGLMKAIARRATKFADQLRKGAAL
ncbi:MULTISPECIES: hypothetical protein [Citrobacter]|uniref:hypothetical protein n=1 Tax=Citrobacter TaxID=544 RepID=UPI0021ADFD8A|nr:MULTISPECIES: hypothetical protein [Citrobacter]MDM3428840.1 hypothetical protein [Citrobacter sp. Cb023]MDM3436901.1 hypothetical protein [Citrobacter sp. Cb034]WFO41409.1 hypothetical protein MJ613_14370 [Citrobacter braakii]